MNKKIKKSAPYIVGGLTGIIVAIVLLVLQVEALSFAVGFVCFGICFVLHIFVHETGHLVAGKMSGYDFVSIRFFNMIFIRKDGKLSRKKFRIKGTLGQCLMSPPEPVNGKYPFVFYNLGGSLMNFAVSAVSLALFFILPSESWILVIFAAVGALLGILNILPLNLGFPTDGHNALTLGKNDVARRALWLILHINAQITKGMRLRDIPEKQFDFLDSASLNDARRNNAIVSNAESYRFEWLIDRHEFEKAKVFAEHLLNTAKKMLDLQKNELLCELLFLELIGECRKEEIDRLYAKDVKKYIQDTSSYVSRQRLLYAYAKLFLKDDIQAAKALKKFNKVCLTYPLTGEVAGNREMIEMIDRLATEKLK